MWLRGFILFFLVFFVGLVAFAFNQIDLNLYSKIRTYVTKKKINFHLTGTASCDFFENGEYFYILPACFFQKKLPKLSVKQSLDLVWPYIKDFPKVYDLNSTGFFYFSSLPEFYINFSLTGLVGTGKGAFDLASIFSKNGVYLKVPKLFIALNQVRDYSFYVSTKDLSNRKGGRLRNFNIAIGKIDNFVLYPGKSLLYNKLIAYAKGYFTGKSKKKYMFYDGVCGTSTMIFRLALISPQIFVEKRYNHNHRYWKYYSKYLFGDDAALYEMKKILKIKNISKKPYYFKVKRIGRKIYLVGIYPEKSNFYTWVQKKQIGHLKAEVKKIVFNQDGGVIYFQKWISKYFGYAN